jgi:low temperature requirement protein LtrA
VAGVVLVFSMWWLYFDTPADDLLTSLSAALRWGYGHYLVFAAVAAVGAGLELAVDFETGHTELSSLPAGLATAVPVAVYLLLVWLLQVRPRPEAGWLNVAFPLVALLVLASPLTPAPVPVTAALLAALVAAKIWHGRRASVLKG